MPDHRMLNVVDEDGNVLQEETRENIHRQGLLHREVHVWFYTPKGEILFQHRAKSKDTFPDLLDATAGGHVEIGMDFVGTALQEIEEETGVHATPDDLTFVTMMRNSVHDDVTHMTNNTLRAVYAYCYTGSIDDLKVEEGKAEGFEAWPITRLFTATDEEKKRFIFSIFDEEILGIFKKIQLICTL